MTDENGSSTNIRWLHLDQAILYDRDGEIVRCKCGNPAGMGIFGKEAFVARCADCAPMSKKSVEFVYKDPKASNS